MLTFLFQHHLEEDEKLVAVIHRYPLLLFRGMALPTLCLFALGLLLYHAPFRGVLIVGGVGSVLVLLWLLRAFLDYFLDVWLLTDQAVLTVSWEGFLHRISTRIVLSDIQGVAYEVEGLLGTILRYGTVVIEKISTGMTISLSHVPHPRSVAGRILKQQEEYLTAKNLKDARVIREVLSEIVAQQLQLKSVRGARNQ